MLVMRRDKKRALAPLIIPETLLIVDTSELDQDEVLFNSSILLMNIKKGLRVLLVGLFLRYL
jgi:cytidylate kinase